MTHCTPRAAFLLSLVNLLIFSSARIWVLANRSGQYFRKREMGTCRFCVNEVPIDLCMAMTLPWRSKSGPPESPPTMVQSVMMSEE